MSRINFELFNAIVNLARDEFHEIKELVDPDVGKTLARITPILGDELNVTTLGILSRFLTELFFEDAAVSDESYVVLSGVKLPVTSFRVLRELSSVPPMVVRRLAETMASCDTSVVFPDAFVDLHEFFGNGRSDIHVLADRHFEPMTREAILNFSMKIVDQHRQTSGALTPPVSGGEHASS